MHANETPISLTYLLGTCSRNRDKDIFMQLCLCIKISSYAIWYLFFFRLSPPNAECSYPAIHITLLCLLISKTRVIQQSWASPPHRLSADTSIICFQKPLKDCSIRSATWSTPNIARPFLLSFSQYDQLNRICSLDFRD